MKLHLHKRINGRGAVSGLVAGILCLFMLALPLLTGCDSSGDTVYDSRLNFVTTNGVSVFRIVYPQNDCPVAVLDAANELQAAMQEVLGVDVAITDDKGSVNATDQFQPYEILVGQTARAASQKVLPELQDDQFIVRADGHKIAIVGGTNRATVAGVRYFIQNVIRKGETEDGLPVVKIEKDYEYRGEYELPKQHAVAGNTVLPVAPYRPVMLYTVDQPTNVSDQVTLATLQGLSALYSSEQIFVLREDNRAQLAALTEQGITVIDHNDAEESWTLPLLLEYYGKRLNGYILCAADEASESAEVAISLAHYLGAVVVTTENEEVAKAAGLSLVLDVTDKNDAWLRTTPYFDQMSRVVAIEPDVSFGMAFVDYAVMVGCYYHDYRGGDEYMHIQTFKHMAQGSYLLGLPTNDVHRTLTFEAAGISVLTPDVLYRHNLSVLISANAKEIEAALLASK